LCIDLLTLLVVFDYVGVDRLLNHPYFRDLPFSSVVLCLESLVFFVPHLGHWLLHFDGELLHSRDLLLTGNSAGLGALNHSGAMLDRGDLNKLVVNDGLPHHLLLVDEDRASSLNWDFLPDRLPCVLGRGVEMAVRMLVHVMLERRG